MCVHTYVHVSTVIGDGVVCVYMCTYIRIRICVCAYCQWSGVTYPHVCTYACHSSRLEWSALVDPVIDKACNGFVVSPHLARALHFIKDEPLIVNSTIFNNTFYNGGQLAKVLTYVHTYVCTYVCMYMCVCCTSLWVWGVRYSSIQFFIH